MTQPQPTPRPVRVGDWVHVKGDAPWRGQRASFCVLSIYREEWEDEDRARLAGLGQTYSFKLSELET